MRRFIISGLAAALLASTAAWAGPVADSEAALRQVYGQYRVALFATNMGNAAKSTESLGAFAAGWTGLAETLPIAPQYQDDTAAPATFAAVTALAAEAQAAVDAGDLAKAHEVLEAVRAEIGGLHGRNGIIGFSDRMNAYHAAMEAVLVLDPTALDAAGLVDLAAQTGVLVYLAQDIANHPAPEAADPAYAPLADAMQLSVQALTDAVTSGDPAAMKAAIATLKPAYSKFFVQFG